MMEFNLQALTLWIEQALEGSTTALCWATVFGTESGRQT
jgi:hypothetical protein